MTNQPPFRPRLHRSARISASVLALTVLSAATLAVQGREGGAGSKPATDRSLIPIAQAQPYNPGAPYQRAYGQAQLPAPADQGPAAGVYPGQPGQILPGQPGQVFPGQPALPGQAGQIFPGPASLPYGQPPAQPYPGQSLGSTEPLLQGRWPEPGQGPVIVPPISFIDVNSGRFGKLEIDLEDGQFMDGAVDKLHLTAKNMDLTQGQLASLDVDVRGGHFQDFTIDRLTLSTQGALNFDSGVLFNHRMLQFTSPALAQVTAVVSQMSLNRFLNAPRTLDRLSVTAMKRASILGNLLGQGANFGLSFTSANLALQSNNRLNLSMQTRIGVGQVGLPIPFELNTKLGLKDGWVNLFDTHLATGGQEISPELSAAVVNKVNSLSSWGQKSDDIHFTFTDLKVVPGNQFILKGTAEVRRLRFGRNQV